MKKPICKIDTNGDKTWYISNKIHREDGPAMETTRGDKIWVLNDKIHREDGPAVERFDGTKKWFLDHKELTEQEFKIFILKKHLDKILEE